MASNRVLQTKQIADAIGCSTKTVRRYYHAGKLPGATKFGQSTSPIKIHEKDLQKLLRKKRR
ncbi:helix-turn-helix domain-containing protein [Mesorhizobium sp. J428]|uniref:helix-turn-helix domain-containing protein n=1 Tax=Mesorhizobium sp. J428 TaxID=2898440 RepID=UPI002150ECA7|nr:helix-turn-helix domain-containing protein [Mesorhizobium sp. J428]MCR5856588.1 helix-turn-helix domain-containing protein [Mesorhizobium sp. J428]